MDMSTMHANSVMDFQKQLWSVTSKFPYFRNEMRSSFPQKSDHITTMLHLTTIDVIEKKKKIVPATKAGVQKKQN